MIIHSIGQMDLLLKQGMPGTRSYNRDMAGRPPLKDAPKFGQRLAALRKAKGWTQPKLADELGITLAALTYYERQARNPSAEFVAKVAKLFKVTSDELLGVTLAPMKKSGPPSQVEERLTAIRGLPREKQKVVLQFLDSFLQTNGSRANGP
jgi:transcriptional regulator with XRE-family HTH domain